MSSNVVVLLSSEEGRALIRARSKDRGLSPPILQELIEAELEQQGKMRKAGLWEEFDRIFDSLDDEDAA